VGPIWLSAHNAAAATAADTRSGDDVVVLAVICR